MLGLSRMTRGLQQCLTKSTSSQNFVQVARKILNDFKLKFSGTWNPQTNTGTGTGIQLLKYKTYLFRSPALSSGEKTLNCVLEFLVDTRRADGRDPFPSLSSWLSSVLLLLLPLLLKRQLFILMLLEQQQLLRRERRQQQCWHSHLNLNIWRKKIWVENFFRGLFTSTHEPCFLKFPCLACSHHCISSIG